MRPVTLLILTLLVVGLGAFIWFFERELPSTEERRELEVRLLPIQVDDVHRLLIDHDGGRARLERTIRSDEEIPQQWHLAEPFGARADGDEVRSVLGDLTSLQKKRSLDGIEPSEVGLETPRLELTIAALEREWRLSVGGKVPATDDVVVSVDGKGVFITSGGFIKSLEREPGEWRARKIIDGGRDRIHGVRSTTPEGELVLTRQDGRFLLEEPVADEADEEMVRELLTALTELEVEEFLDGAGAETDHGSSPPAYEVAVTLEGRGEPLLVRLGALMPDGELRVGEAEQQRFTIDTELPEILDRPHAMWQSRDWTGLQPFEMDSVRIDLDGVESELTRADGEWRRDGETISYSVATDFLDAVASARGERVLRDEANRADESGGLSLVITAGDDTETLKLLSSDDGLSVAAREGRKYLRELTPETADELDAAARAVRDAGVELAAEPSGDG